MTMSSVSMDPPHHDEHDLLVTEPVFPVTRPPPPSSSLPHPSLPQPHSSSTSQWMHVGNVQSGMKRSGSGAALAGRGSKHTRQPQHIAIAASTSATIVPRQIPITSEPSPPILPMRRMPSITHLSATTTSLWLEPIHQDTSNTLNDAPPSHADKLQIAAAGLAAQAHLHAVAAHQLHYLPLDMQDPHSRDSPVVYASPQGLQVADGTNYSHDPASSASSSSFPSHPLRTHPANFTFASSTTSTTSTSTILPTEPSLPPQQQPPSRSMHPHHVHALRRSNSQPNAHSLSLDNVLAEEELHGRHFRANKYHQRAHVVEHQWSEQLDAARKASIIAHLRTQFADLDSQLLKSDILDNPDAVSAALQGRSVFVPPPLKHDHSTLSIPVPPSPRTRDGPSPKLGGMPGVYVLLVLAQLLWSGFHVLGRYIFAYMSPFVMPTFRSIGVFPLFLLFAYKMDPNFWRITRRQHLQLFVLALLGNTFAQQLFNFGVKLSSAGDAGLFQPVIPIVCTLLSAALGRERLTRYKVGGVACAIVGCLAIVYAEFKYGDANTSTTRVYGDLMFVLQSVCSSIYIVYQKPLFTQGIATPTFTFFIFFYGGFGHILIGAFFYSSVDWAHMPLTVIPAIFYTVVFATFAAFSCFVYACKHLPASIASLGISIQSFSSPLFGAIFLGELVTGFHVLGGVCIVAGIALVVYGKQRETEMEKQMLMHVIDEEKTREREAIASEASPREVVAAASTSTVAAQAIAKVAELERRMQARLEARWGTKKKRKSDDIGREGDPSGGDSDYDDYDDDTDVRMNVDARGHRSDLHVDVPSSASRAFIDMDEEDEEEEEEEGFDHDRGAAEASLTAPNYTVDGIDVDDIDDVAEAQAVVRVSRNAASSSSSSLPSSHLPPYLQSAPASRVSRIPA